MRIGVTMLTSLSVNASVSVQRAEEIKRFQQCVAPYVAQGAPRVNADVRLTMHNRWPCPLPRPPHPRRHPLAVPIPVQHRHWRKSCVHRFHHALLRSFHRVLRPAAQHIRRKHMAGRGESGIAQHLPGLAQRFQIVGRVVGEIQALRFQLPQFGAMPRFQNLRLKPASELGPLRLPSQHGEHRPNMCLRAGQQVVVQNVVPVLNRQLPHRAALPLPDGAEPALVWASPACDRVAFPHKTPRREILASRHQRWAAHRTRRDMPPLALQPFGGGQVPSERHADLHAVGFVEQSRPDADPRAVIGRRCDCLTRKHSYYPFHFKPLGVEQPLPPLPGFRCATPRRVKRRVVLIYIEKTNGQS